MNTIDLQSLRSETARVLLQMKVQLEEHKEMLEKLAESEGSTPYNKRELEQDIDLLQVTIGYLGGQVTHFAKEAPTSLHQV